MRYRLGTDPGQDVGSLVEFEGRRRADGGVPLVFLDLGVGGHRCEIGGSNGLNDDIGVRCQIVHGLGKVFSAVDPRHLYTGRYGDIDVSCNDVNVRTSSSCHLSDRLPHPSG